MSHRQQITDYTYCDVLGDVEIFWEKRMSYDGGGNLEYVGYNANPNAPTTDESWYIVKLTYSGADVIRQQLPDGGPVFKYAWDSRTTYFS